MAEQLFQVEEADLDTRRVPALLHSDRTDQVIYKVTGAYERAAERGAIRNDPDIGVNWPITTDKVILSDKDRVLPRLRDLPVLFDV